MQSGLHEGGGGEGGGGWGRGAPVMQTQTDSLFRQTPVFFSSISHAFQEIYAAIFCSFSLRV